jgi:hypothetical protein
MGVEIIPFHVLSFINSLHQTQPKAAATYPSYCLPISKHAAKIKILAHTRKYFLGVFKPSLGFLGYK